MVFSSNGLYVPKLSKCDCPNGWLFCSHTLATFLMIRMIQTQADWTMHDIINFMPVPIKSLQSVPFAASYVFGELRVSRHGPTKGNKNKRLTRVVLTMTAQFLKSQKRLPKTYQGIQTAMQLTIQTQLRKINFSRKIYRSNNRMLT